MMPGVITAQDYSMVCQLMWHLLAILPGVSSAQDYSTGVSADLVCACHDAWCDNCSNLLNQLMCQLMWLAMMAGLTTAQDYSTSVNTSQDYSTGVSADVVSDIFSL